MNSILNPDYRHILFLAEKSREQAELAEHLSLENFIVHPATKINDALQLIPHTKADIFLIDSSRNEVACFELCHAIKSNIRWMKAPVILLSDKQNESSEVAAFRAGADDYLSKPVRPIALVERIKVRMNEPKDVITVQGETDSGTSIHIDRRSYTVYAGNQALNLSRKEFELLYLLASQPGKIFRREEVFAKIWNKKFDETNRTVDVHILRLRKKLGQHSIHTQKGVGYRFKI